jgi:hypothetical protein
MTIAVAPASHQARAGRGSGSAPRANRARLLVPGGIGIESTSKTCTVGVLFMASLAIDQLLASNVQRPFADHLFFMKNLNVI